MNKKHIWSIIHQAHCHCLHSIIDTVPHKELLSKLEYYGIRGSTNIGKWISVSFQKAVEITPLLDFLTPYIEL